MKSKFLPGIIQGTTAKTNDAKTQESKAVWLTTIPRVAERMASQGIIVAYPKVFLALEDKLQCAGNAAQNYFVFPNGRVYQCPICEDFLLHSFEIIGNALVPRPKPNEKDLFGLDIPEGCVMNKMIQPGNLAQDKDGSPLHKTACCMLKEEIIP